MAATARSGPVTRSQTRALKAANGGDSLEDLGMLSSLPSGTRSIDRRKGLHSTSVNKKNPSVQESFAKEGVGPLALGERPCGCLGGDDDLFRTAEALFAQASSGRKGSLATENGRCGDSAGSACSSPKSVLMRGCAEKGEDSGEPSDEDAGLAPEGETVEDGLHLPGTEAVTFDMRGELSGCLGGDVDFFKAAEALFAQAPPEHRGPPASENGLCVEMDGSTRPSSSWSPIVGYAEKGEDSRQLLVEDSGLAPGSELVEDGNGLTGAEAVSSQVVMDDRVGETVKRANEAEPLSSRVYEGIGLAAPEKTPIPAMVYGSRSTSDGQVIMAPSAPLSSGHAEKEEILNKHLDTDVEGLCKVSGEETWLTPGREQVEDGHGLPGLKVGSSQTSMGDVEQAEKSLVHEEARVSLNKLAGSKHLGGFLEMDLSAEEVEEVKCRMRELRYRTVIAVLEGASLSAMELLARLKNSGEVPTVLKVDPLGRGCFEVLLSDDKAVSWLVKEHFLQLDKSTCFFYKWQPGFIAKEKARLHVPIFRVEMYIADVPTEFYCRPILKHMVASVGELDKILGRCCATGDVKLCVRSKGGMWLPDRLRFSGSEFQFRVTPGRYFCTVCGVTGHGQEICTRAYDNLPAGKEQGVVLVNPGPSLEPHPEIQKNGCMGFCEEGASNTHAQKGKTHGITLLAEGGTSLTEVVKARAYVDLLRGSCSKSASAEGEHISIKRLEHQDVRPHQFGRDVKPRSSTAPSNEKKLVELRLRRAGDKKMLAYWDKRVGYSFVKFFKHRGVSFPLATKNFLVENVGWSRRNFFIQMHDVEHVNNTVVLHAEMIEHVRCYSPRGPLAWVPGEKIYCGSYG